MFHCLPVSLQNLGLFLREIPKRGPRVDVPILRLAAENGASETLRSSIQSQLVALREEWRRLLPMCSLFFFMAFINTLINSLSLSLVMTSTGGGAVVIPFLNVYAVLPASVIFTLCYAYASHHLTRDKLFNFVIGAFALLVVIFAYGLYPHHHALHLHGFSDKLTHVHNLPQ